MVTAVSDAGSANALLATLAIVVGVALIVLVVAGVRWSQIRRDEKSAGEDALRALERVHANVAFNESVVGEPDWNAGDRALYALLRRAVLMDSVFTSALRKEPVDEFMATVLATPTATMMTSALLRQGFLDVLRAAEWGHTQRQG